MSRPRSLLRSLVEGLFSDLTAPEARAVSRPRPKVLGARVGELIESGNTAVPPPPATGYQVVESTAARVTLPRTFVWFTLAALLSCGWGAFSGNLSFAALTTPDAVPPVMRCAGARELDVALAQAKSMGLNQASLRVRSGPLWEAAPIRIQVHSVTPDAPTAPGSVLSVRFSEQPPVNFELVVPGEPFPDVIEGRTASPEPVGLIRQRAWARGLDLKLERLSGGQVQPLSADGGRTLWEYAVRFSGSGPVRSLRELLADLDGAEWLCHVQDLEAHIDGQRARFTVEGTLITSGHAGPGSAAPLALSERRVVAIDPTDALALRPAGIATLTRVGQRLAVVTARRGGAASLRIRGESAREIPFQVAAPERIVTPEQASQARTAARPPPFPRLLGTSVAEAGARALFAEKDAREGEPVGPYRVDQITEDGVRLSWQGRRFYVPLSGSAREEVELDGDGQDIGSSKAETR